jgi:hypothetical protein
MPKENAKTSYQLNKMTFIDRFKERLNNEKNLYQRLGYHEYVNFRSRWIKEFFAQQDKIFLILWTIGVFIFGGMIWMIVTFVFTYKNLNARALELMSLDFYQATELKTNSYTASEVPRLNNLYDVINLIHERQDLKQRYQEYFESLSEVYRFFLKYIYLPSLNIWKDSFTKQINANLIGRDFLDNNIYQDIKLIEKWSNYFRDVGANNQFNDITNIQLGDIQERDDGYFTIPLTLSFSSPNKRAFLLLVDKISVTSNRKNISLINEFTYHLWQIIKTEKVSYLDLVLT